MTDREELIGQAVRVLHDGTCGGGCDTWADFVHPAKSLVDAGWRPPVSGDVVEQAARTVQAAVADRQFAFAQEFYDAGHGGDYPPTRCDWDHLADFEQDAWRAGAQRLADAGLLAATPVPGEVDDIPAQEFLSIPIPPDAETVERVARASYEAYPRTRYNHALERPEAVGWDELTPTVRGIERFRAAAALRALTEVSTDE